MLWLTRDASKETRMTAGALFDPITATHFHMSAQFVMRAATLRERGRIYQLELLYSIAVATGSR
jgi:hypothetical protein